MGELKLYKIIPPPIPSAGVYNFTTDSEIKYEVRFGRKQNDLLCATIVFGVLNEEYEGEEYVLTEKHESYRVLSTIVEIINIFRGEHPNIRSYEFTGEPITGESNDQPTKRLRIYHRYVQRIFDKSWTIEIKGNKIVVYKPFQYSR